LGILIGEALLNNNNWLRKACLEKPVPKYKEKYRDLGSLVRYFSNLPLGSRLIRERANKLIIRNELTLEERELLLEVLINREEALAFN
jgi:hypothetical protein